MIRDQLTMTEQYDTVVIGGGQAGLVTGYYLQQQGRDFIILDAGTRVGDTWRHRWDSLCAFTPARYTYLPGLHFPSSPYYFPTKDEIAEYLETYADTFDLPIELDTRVDRLEEGDVGFRITASERHIEASNVVVAMASYQKPFIPDFADTLADDIVQLHTKEYRNPDQLQNGGILIVGAGNSGAEIALDVAPHHDTWLSGRDVGHVPFHVDSWIGRHLGVPFVMRVLFHRILTTRTPPGRRVRPGLLTKGGPLVRVKPGDLSEAGIKRVPRTTGVEDGLPIVGEAEQFEVANVIWCTGFRPDFSWIDLPVFGEHEHPKEPIHHRGIVSEAPGLYFVGLTFLYAMTSSLFTGVGRDARHVVAHLGGRD